MHLSKGTNACLPDMPSYNKHAVHLSKGTGAKHRCYTSTASSTRSMYIQPIWPYSIFKPNLIEGLSNQLVRPLRKPYLSTNIMLLQCIGCNKVSKLCMQQRAREMILKNIQANATTNRTLQARTANTKSHCGGGYKRLLYNATHVRQCA